MCIHVPQVVLVFLELNLDDVLLLFWELFINMMFYIRFPPFFFPFLFYFF